MRMPMKFKKVIRAFRSPVMVKTWIETGAYVHGRWSKTVSEPRNIDAIILTLDPEQLQFYSVGNASKGGVAIHTLEVLYISDVNHEGVEQQQSYIEWNNYSFRISGTGFATPNSDHYTYIGLEYTDYGVNPN